MTKPAPIAFPSMLSHVLVRFSRDYSDSVNDLPSLAVLSNILRVIGTRGVYYKELPSLSRISQRAARIATQYLERDGWLTIEPANGKAPKVVRLTASGKRTRDLEQAHHKSMEQQWETRYGKTRVMKLREALRSLVMQFAIELPHYPTSYGQGDTSMTGGAYVPSDPGPPRIPAHGAEWPVVLRDDRDAVSNLALTALASQALTAFTIDYDEDAESQLGGLHGVVTFLRLVTNAGMPLGEASPIAGVNGTGRSRFERHRLVTVEPKKRDGGERLVVLTALGKRVRDRYPTKVIEVEKQWRSQFGSTIVNNVRASLEALDSQLSGDLPDFPAISDWLQSPNRRRR
jgi:hypothetical protein